jgi:hypothetical protein
VSYCGTVKARYGERNAVECLLGLLHSTKNKLQAKCDGKRNTTEPIIRKGLTFSPSHAPSIKPAYAKEKAEEDARNTAKHMI